VLLLLVLQATDILLQPQHRGSSIKAVKK
jgi:hypothetical protein